MPEDLRSTLARRVVIADGAMGTMLQGYDLTMADFDQLEGCNEVLNRTRPDVVRAIHDAYFEVGVDAVETNTFGTNLSALGEYGISEQIFDLAERAARIARESADAYSTVDRSRWVLGSVGPGTKLPTLGHVAYGQLRDAYQTQVEGMLAGGIDAVLIETSQDLLQTKAATLGAKRALAHAGRDLPVIVHVTVETTGTMLLGSEIGAALTALEPLGIDLIGLNCATGPAEMSEHLRHLSRYAQIGVSCMPNAGLPQLTADGVMMIGDTAGMLNGERLKGIHTAIKAGMLAAETILDCLVKNDFSRNALGVFDKKLKESYVGRELYKARNFHQAFDRGRMFGLMTEGISILTGGRFPSKLPIKAGHEHMQKLRADGGKDPYVDLRYDGQLTFDKLTDVYYSGTHHNEDQPAHLKVLDFNICVGRCVEEFGNPCQNFCPANVYEMVDGGESKRRLQINFSNCVHCKTCDIMDPYQIIDWVPPEGGGGPNYRNM